MGRLRRPTDLIMKKNIETKREELQQFIKTVGGPSIWVMYNHYLTECGCEDLIPDGAEE